ncbi:MAG: PAS domain S-box protein [Spirochaetes bacterium]|nr:PAS domain S-box protein [Spirochaetota bacterium]
MTDRIRVAYLSEGRSRSDAARRLERAYPGRYEILRPPPEDIDAAGADIALLDAADSIIPPLALSLRDRIPMLLIIDECHQPLYAGSAPWPFEFIMRPVRPAELAARIETTIMRFMSAADAPRGAGLAEEWEKLSESEERFRKLADTTPMAIMLYQGDRWIYMNASTETITGYRADEMLRMNFWDIVHPDHREIAKERGRKRQTGSPTVTSYEFKIITKSGDEKWVLLNGTTSIFGGKPAALINVIDITEQKRVQKELNEANTELLRANEEISSAMEELEATNEEFEAMNEELQMSHRHLESSERRYRDMLENVPVGIYQTSPDGRFLTVNPEMARILGYDSPEELLKLHNIATDIYADPEIRTRFTDMIEKNQEIKDFETRFRKKNGDIIWVCINARVRRDETGRVINYDGYIRDITQHKAASEEQERLERQLQQAQKMEAVGRLAGGIAHDFNNLLTAIIGNAELSLMIAAEAGHEAEYIRDILATANRAAELTRQLLAFSRKQVIKPVAVNLNDLLARMERMLRRIIGEDIAISINGDPGLSPIEADPTQIEQLVVNLVVNARDAMPRGGILEISTGTAVITEGSSAKAGPSPGSYMTISFRDSGSGMEKEIIDHIFEPFFTTKGDMGTGLGLSMVYGVVKQYRGYITVTSEVNKGSTFTVYLPRIEARVSEGPREIQEPPPEVRDFSGTMILVVEDEEAVRRIAVKALTQRGFRVVAASDGRAAIEMCERYGGDIHLMLTDVILPGMNGAELARRITGICPGIRVLFMSGYTGQTIGEQGLIGDGDNFLPKPFLPSDLVKKIEEVLIGT